MKESKTRIRRKNGGYKKLLLLIIILAIIILILSKVIFPATVTVSRYVYNVFKGIYFNSKEFYFTSDKLSNNGSEFKVENWSGTITDKYQLTVKMFSRKNTLKASKDDIEYSIEFEVSVYKNHNATPVETVLINSTTNPGVTDFSVPFNTAALDVHIEKLNGIIRARADNTDNFYIRLDPRQEGYFEEGDRVHISMTAKTESPYKETLYGDVDIIVGKEGISYKIEDYVGSEYFNFILTNASNEDKTVELGFDPNVILVDTASKAYALSEKKPEWTQTIDGESYVNKINIAINSMESKNVKFYKRNADLNYTDTLSIIDVNVID